METIKYTLTEDQMPQAWYNIQADLPTPLPPVLHPPIASQSAVTLTCRPTSIAMLARLTTKVGFRASTQPTGDKNFISETKQL